MVKSYYTIRMSAMSLQYNLQKEMTQDERWMARYNEVMEFLEENHRNPSKHRIEEHDHLNWLKANRKALNAGKMKLERVEKFRKLLEMTEQYRRKNQWE